MTTPIAPGVWIEAADADARRVAGTKPYLCIEVVPTGMFQWPCLRCGELSEGLKIKDLPNTRPTSVWCPAHWRPIYSPPAAFKESLFERNLLPNEEVERIYTDAII